MALNLNLELFPHQHDFLTDNTTRELALVGGRGCGKTEAFSLKMIVQASLHTGYVGAALSPTGKMAKQVLIDGESGISRMLDKHQIKHRFHKTDRRYEIFFDHGTTVIYILSAENIRDALGFNLAFFGMDEADTMDTEVAFESWRKLSGALRSGNERHAQKFAVSTPEGFGFMFQHWVQDVNETNQAQRRLIRGKSLDNIYLPDNYFDDLRATYPANYLKAYMEGEFVNMAGHTVYDHYEYENGENCHGYTYEDIGQQEILHIGLDFNVVGMSAIVAVIRAGTAYVIDEIVGVHNTPAMIAKIKEKFSKSKFVIYPDASGAFRNQVTDDTNHSLLRNEGYDLRMHGRANPRVTDRVNSVNAMFYNGNGNRRLLINRVTCPALHKSLITQTWVADGKPDKKTKIGLPTTADTSVDGPIDALGYFIYNVWPIRAGDQVTQLKLVA